MIVDLSGTISRLTERAPLRRFRVPAYRAATRAVFWYPPPKVIAISMPKAGTHLLGRVLDLLPSMMFSGLHLSEEQVFDTNTDSATEAFDGDVLQRTLDRCQTGHYMTAHFPHSASLVAQLENTGARVLVIVRDPRDVAVSYVHYVCKEPTHFHHEYYTTGLHTFDERLAATIQGFEPGPLRDIGLRSLQANVTRYTSWLESGVTCVRFEDLIGHRGGGTQAAQMNAVSLIASAVDRELSDHKTRAIAERAFSTEAQTFRSGKAQGWVNEFSAQHVELCSDGLDDAIAAFGYQRTSRVIAEPGRET